MYVCRSPEKGDLLHVGKNIRSPSKEPHAHIRPTYNGVGPGSPRGSLMTLLSLPQCQAASSRKLQRMLPGGHKFYICIKYIQNTVWHCTIYTVSARHVSYIFHTNAKLEYCLEIFYVMSLNMAR
jgi:hypothetical protein